MLCKGSLRADLQPDSLRAADAPIKALIEQQVPPLRYALAKDTFPQGLKPDLVRTLTYGLKPVPFRGFSSTWVGRKAHDLSRPSKKKKGQVQQSKHTRGTPVSFPVAGFAGEELMNKR